MTQSSASTDVTFYFSSLHSRRDKLASRSVARSSRVVYSPRERSFQKALVSRCFFFFALLPREPDDSCHSYDSVVEPTPIRKDFYYTRSVVVAEIHFFALFTLKKDYQKEKKKLC